MSVACLARRRTAVLWLSLTLLLLAADATAQRWPREETPSTVPVYEIKRPDYEPPGLRLGTLLANPAASETVTLDDNIFATRNQPHFDIINTTQESFTWHSDWSRHGWSGRLFSAQEFYRNHDREDADSYGAETEGVLDITRNAYAQVNAAFLRQPQSRASIEANTGRRDRPIYDTASVGTALGVRSNRVTDRLEIELRRIDYVTSGDQSREGRHQAARNRLGFDFSERFGLFLDTEYEEQKWDERSDLRNSHVLTAVAGVRAEEPTVVMGQLGIGLSRQTFQFDGFDTLLTPVVRGDLLWNVRPLTSLILAVDRTVTGTEFFCNAAAGCVSSRRDSLTISSGEIGLQHEFYHDLLGRVRLRYERDAFDRINLIDDTYTSTAELKYLINRNVEVAALYTHRSRTANLPFDRTYNSGPYTENILGFTLKASL